MKNLQRFPSKLGICCDWGIGDWLLFTPALRAIKQLSPLTRIYVLGKEKCKYFLKTSSYIDGYSLYPDLSVFKKHFSRDDKVLVPEFIRFIWRAKCRKHLVDFIFKVLDLDVPDRRPEIKLDERDDHFGRDFSAKFKNRLAVLCDKSSNPWKRWERRKWDQVIKKFPELVFVQIGDYNDHPNRGVVNLIGRTTLPQAISLVKHARVFVGSDGMLSHIANFYGVPKVLLWGPDAPFNYAYEGVKTVNLWGKTSCSPCYFRVNRFCERRANTSSKPRRCMDEIGSDKVSAAITKLISSPSSEDIDGYYAGSPKNACSDCAYAHECTADFFFRPLSDLYFFRLLDRL